MDSEQKESIQRYSEIIQLKDKIREAVLNNRKIHFDAHMRLDEGRRLGVTKQKTKGKV